MASARRWKAAGRRTCSVMSIMPSIWRISPAPQRRSATRRLLHPLESMERDAIVQALLDSHGNKVKTAESLGMSRATVYRKIHQYGIVTPAS